MTQQAPTSPTVLVVEDDLNIRGLVAELLRHEHFTVMEAGNADAAVWLARERHPDMILLDLMLPGKSGVDALYELKSARQTQPIPVVIMSAFTVMLPTQAQRLVAAIVRKPFELDELVDLVQRLTPPLKPTPRPS